MQSRDGLSIIELLLVVVIIGIIAALSIPNYIAMQARAKEADTLALARVVQLAAEDHAAAHEGVYSDLAADIVPRLPGGQLQRNPFTGQDTEPQCGQAAATPGQVGIETYLRQGVPVGYSITAWGKDGQLMTFTGGQ